MICPHCGKEIDPKIYAAEMGRRGKGKTSPAKVAAARLNAKKPRPGRKKVN